MARRSQGTSIASHRVPITTLVVAISGASASSVKLPGLDAGSVGFVTGSKPRDEPDGRASWQVLVDCGPDLFSRGGGAPPTGSRVSEPGVGGRGRARSRHPRQWVLEQDGEHDRSRPGDVAPRGTVVDLARHRIISEEIILPLSNLEYRVLSALLVPPGRALAFRELRGSGLGRIAGDPRGHLLGTGARSKAQSQTPSGEPLVSRSRRLEGSGPGHRADARTWRRPPRGGSWWLMGAPARMAVGLTNRPDGFMTPGSHSTDRTVLS